MILKLPFLAFLFYLFEVTYAGNLTSIKIGDHRCLRPWQWLTHTDNETALWHGTPVGVFRGIRHKIPPLRLIRLHDPTRPYGVVLPGVLDIWKGITIHTFCFESHYHI